MEDLRSTQRYRIGEAFGATFPLLPVDARFLSWLVDAETTETADNSGV